MKKVLATTLVIALSFAHVVSAQNEDLEDEVNAELERVYSQQKNNESQAVRARQGSSVQVNVNAAPIAANSTESGQGTYQVAPQSTSAQTTAPAVSAPTMTNVAPVTVVKQPTVSIEASPLQESRADMLRRSRQDAEVGTEQKIVEKLESSRLEDEKRRSDVLFGDKFNQLGQQNTQQVIVPQQQVQQYQPIYAPVQQAPVVQEQVVAPKYAATPEDKMLDEEMVKAEVAASIAQYDAEKNAKPKSKNYLAGGVGIGEYVDAVNVKNNYNLSFAIGSKVSDHVLVEGNFNYGNYQIEQRTGYGYWNSMGYGSGFPYITDMDQYSLGGTAKYQLFNGVFRPVFGGTLAYTYRTFSDKQFGMANNDAQSHSLDAGLVAGADLELSEDFALGLEFKYMFLNFLNRNQNRFSRGFSQSVYGNETPIERLQQMTISVMGRATF